VELTKISEVKGFSLDCRLLGAWPGLALDGHKLPFVLFGRKGSSWHTGVIHLEHSLAWSPADAAFALN